MYEPFPGNYVWNLSVNLLVSMGGAIGEIAAVADRLRSEEYSDESAASRAFAEAWSELADRLERHGQEAERQGHLLTAAEKYRRAVAYYVTGERMGSPQDATRQGIYRKLLKTMDRFIAISGVPVERVEIPFENGRFPGLFVRGDGDGARPCVVFANGLDGVKEMIYLAGVGEVFARRGISTLILDHPGVGEALRLRGMPAMVDSERWASAAVDFLEMRTDVASDLIGMVGWSLGGYYAPRAAAFEKRFRLCAAWGANHDWGEVQQLRLARQSELSVPHYWHHAMWVWGKASFDELIAFVP